MNSIDISRDGLKEGSLEASQEELDVLK